MKLFRIASLHSWIPRSLAAVSAAILLSTTLSCGLLLNDAKQINTFDLKYSEAKEKHPYSLEIRTFNGNSRSKMTWRTDGQKVEVDELNRWNYPPEVLLTQYLSAYFSDNNIDGAPGKVPNFIVSGNVLSCDFDLEHKKVNMLIRYSVMSPMSLESEVNGARYFSEDAKEATPEEFAKIVSDCARQFAENVNRIIMNQLKETEAQK